MSRRMKIAAGMIVAGCTLFFLYGITVAVISETTASYQYGVMSGHAEFSALAEEVRSLMSSSVLLIGLEGAGLALCSGVLFWLGLKRGQRFIFLLALIGGTLGVASLLTVHMNQRVWLLFIADNVCLNVIGLGFAVGGKELRDFLLGRPTAA